VPYEVHPLDGKKTSEQTLLDIFKLAHEEYKFFDHIFEDAAEEFIKKYGDQS
jgi:hypothetical protein